MTTKLHRLTLTFRSDGAVDALIIRKGLAVLGTKSMLSSTTTGFSGAKAPEPLYRAGDGVFRFCGRATFVLDEPQRADRGEIIARFALEPARR